MFEHKLTHINASFLKLVVSSTDYNQPCLDEATCFLVYKTFSDHMNKVPQTLPPLNEMHSKFHVHSQVVQMSRSFEDLSYRNPSKVKQTKR